MQTVNFLFCDLTNEVSRSDPHVSARLAGDVLRFHDGEWTVLRVAIQPALQALHEPDCCL